MHRRRQPQTQSQPGLFPPDRQLSGEVLRHRQNPRWLPAPRRPTERQGNAHLSAHRPTSSAVVPEGLHERRPGHCYRDVRRPRHGPRRHLADRLVGGVGGLGHSVRRPHRGGPRRLCGRPLRAQSWPRGLGVVDAQHGRGGYGVGSPDGGIRSQGTDGRPDARWRALRPHGDAGCHRGDQGTCRRSRQTGLGLPAAADRHQLG